MAPTPEDQILQYTSYPKGEFTGKGQRTALRNESSHYELCAPADLEAWRRRATFLRQHILSCCGLWPTPDRTPLNSQVFGATDHDGFTLRKVYFESRPHFYVIGNLFMPREGKPPFPAVLCPHGHWEKGRLEDSAECSVVERCVNFAQQGYVVFCYDMVGFLESTQVEHPWAARLENGRYLGSFLHLDLWGINVAGLQLWNSIRSLDFLESLDEVDASRIGCTGSSGGGTQTCMLTAVDDRVAAAAPVCIVSANYQGGCICEQPPNLRIDTCYPELAAMTAPRPLCIVSASNDRFTANVPEYEFPYLKQIYRLYSQENKVGNAHVHAGHNYNQESRESVYAWFGKWLLRSTQRAKSKEQPRSRLSNYLPKLLVFYGIERPEEANEQELEQYMLTEIQTRHHTLEPQDRQSLDLYRQTFGDVYQHAFLASEPDADELQVAVLGESKLNEVKATTLVLSRRGAGDAVPAIELNLETSLARSTTLIVHEKYKDALVDLKTGRISPIVKNLLQAGQRVLLINCFPAGGDVDPRLVRTWEKNIRFFVTFNRTLIAERVQDVLTAFAYLRRYADVDQFHLLGIGDAGLWCLLARPLTDCPGSTAVDLVGFNQNDDAHWLKRSYVPLIRRAGGLNTAAALISPSRLLIDRCDRSLAEFAEKIYGIEKAQDHLSIYTNRATQTQIMECLHG